MTGRVMSLSGPANDRSTVSRFAAIRRWSAVLALSAAGATAALGTATIRPAGALPILEDADATELAQALAEATEDQDVCYGWNVRVTDFGGGNDGVDQGSSLGVGQPANAPSNAAACPRWAIFEADITYTSAASESEDSASFTVRSNISGGPTSADLREAGISEGGLLGNNDDQVVANATLMLPALMAEKGLAPPIALEANTQPLPAADKATGTPGSDWLRKYGAALAVAVIFLVGGLGLAVWVLVRERPFATPDRDGGPINIRRQRTSGLP